LPGITPEQSARATVMKCNCLMVQKDFQGAIDCAKKGLESAQGTSAAVLKMIIGQAEKQMQQKTDSKDQ
jgi:hypothetical protein